VTEEKKYRKVKVVKGGRGWGGPLIIEPKPDKYIIGSITGGGIHPVAQKIADLTGGEARDCFYKGLPFNQLACAVIDCGGTARVGVYPMKKVPTIDVIPTQPAGPLFRMITAEYFVSGVEPDNVTLVEDE
jgi:PTS system glucitol/sorbitol-specific IIB component